MTRNSRRGKAECLGSHWAVQDRATAILHAEDDAKRERARALRYEEEDRHRTFWRRWIKTAVIVGFSVAGLIIGINQFNRQSEQTRKLFENEAQQNRDMFQAEFDQNRDMFEEEAADRRNARMVRAWRVLKDVKGATGNVGQITALETLYVGGENLRNLSLGCEDYADLKEQTCTYLAGIDLGPIETDGTSKEVDLVRSDLRGVDFREANLFGANLFEVNLSGAKLGEAILSEANLIRANLRWADLRWASLKRAKFTFADLTGADFEFVKGDPDLSGSCADSDDPPINLPDYIKRPEVWEPCPSEERD